MRVLKINNEVISDLLFTCNEIINNNNDNIALHVAMYANGFSTENESSSALLNLARFMEDNSIESIEITEEDGSAVLYSTHYKKLKNISLNVQNYLPEEEDAEPYPIILSLNF